MDKTFMLIVILIIGFWGYLKHMESGNWIAISGGNPIGEYSSYSDCVEGVKTQIDVSVEVFSCSRD